MVVSPIVWPARPRVSGCFVVVATFSTFIALFGCLCKDGRVIRERGALAGFTPIVWSVVALQATGGSLLAQLDALLEGFYELIPPDAVAVFSPAELELLFLGPSL